MTSNELPTPETASSAPQTAPQAAQSAPKARKTPAKAPKTASNAAQAAKSSGKAAKSAGKTPKTTPKAPKSVGKAPKTTPKAAKSGQKRPKPTKTAEKVAKTAKKPAPKAPKDAQPAEPAPLPPKSPRRVWEPLVREACEALSARKGVDIAVLDVEGRTSVCDALVIATAMNAPHLRALADEVAKRLRALDPPRAPYRKSGERTSNWIALDYVDFIVHVLSEDARKYYDLEGLWPDAPRLPLPGEDA